MALLKAWQNQPEIPEHQEYLQASIVYSAECKRNGRVPKEFETSSNPLERLQFADEKRRHRAASKVFHAVRRKWLLAKAQQKIGKAVTPEQIADLLELEIPSTFDELIADSKRNAVAKNTSKEEFELIEKQIRENDAKKLIEGGTVKQQFMRSGNFNPLADETDSKYDPTLDDFAPLPDSSVKKDDEE